MSKPITESDIEEDALAILKSDLGYKVEYGPDISPDGPKPERNNYKEVILTERLKESIRKINPKFPEEAIDQAIKKLNRQESQELIANNKAFHKLLTEGIPVEYKKNGALKHDYVQIIDFENVKNNEFLAINQFTIKAENPPDRRPDIILFINGLPLIVIELKNPLDEKATIWTAFNQLQTYKEELPQLFRLNEILIISDGFQAKAGTITSIKERFMPWKSIGGERMPTRAPQLQILIRGMLHKKVLLDLIRQFIVYETEKEKLSGTINISKKLAAYHQYEAANKAVESTVKATKHDKRAGVLWHTQGSGKSLIMVFYTGKLVLNKDQENPTVIILTDRNDLDDQLFGTFSRCHELLRQEPKQANSREKIKELLKVSSGGVIFTTIQKFLPEEKGKKYPLLSNRRNVIVLVDEAHRSQYEFIRGFARHIRDALPNATFIGFTGTPIEKADKSTPAVFGKYVDTYDVQQAVEDEVTVKIYYENRLAKLELKPEELPHIDPEFEEVTEGEEEEHKEKLKTRWARLEKVVGSEERIRRIAKDLVIHWETRLQALEGKAMIVCMSRRICIELHNEIIKLRPEWYNKEDNKGSIKVVMTGSASDPTIWQEHIRNKERRKAIGNRMKDSTDSLKIAIVRDMWLTGFDAPSLHTMYIDKPMRSHNLMQAIARVNRVFKDKPGGLVVDYLGIAYDLKKALSEYTEGDRKETGIPQDVAVRLMVEKYEIVEALFHGFDYKKFFSAKTAEKLSIIMDAEEHILKQEKGKVRLLKNVSALSKVFALAVPNEKAIEIRDDVGFFQAVRAAIVKTTDMKAAESDRDSAIKQILSKAIVSDRVIDIFAAVGMNKPDISILSEDFMKEVRDMPQKNLAFEMLKKILNNQIKIKQKRNIVQGRSFAEMLEKTIKAYTNRSVETAEVIEQLIDLAKKMKEEERRGKKLHMSQDEIAFYDVLADHDAAKDVLGDKKLREIARELVEKIRKNMSIDWAVRESVQAQLRLMVKKSLKRHGYPPDKQKKATDLVLEQAKLWCENTAEASA